MRGIPGKEYEPTCPECGHKVRIKNGAFVGCDFHIIEWKDEGEVFDVADFTKERKKLTASGYGKKGDYGSGALFVKPEDIIPADLQPKECNHVWTMKYWGHCIKCGQSKPQPQPSQEKHCDHVYVQGDSLPICEKCGNVLLIRRLHPKPVEPAEKRYCIAKTKNLFTLEDAIKEAKRLTLETTKNYNVFEIVGGVTLTKDVEWHEEQ
jgi:hypothetical protein